MDYNQLTTEQVNPLTADIDLCTTEEIVRLINDEDKKVAQAVEAVLPDVAKAVDTIAARMEKGGRLFYIGAGTSGRLGVVDASECPPTFGTDPSLVVGIIAGGDTALRTGIEEIEDQAEQGKADLLRHQISALDTVVGISASGSAAYVAGALQEAKKLGAATVAISNSPHAHIAEVADIAIIPVVGPEAIMGSTRMKAGTSQKMVLNMLSTATMVKLGKTYRNLMVDMIPSNQKLRDRAVRILMKATSLPREKAEEALTLSGNTKTALVMLLTNCDAATARNALSSHNGSARKAVAFLQQDGASL
ncbi:MAG: N-acetylmuramic acid 6-phosphate etherase [Clostridiales bacterium]|nr:MAG: N-acetylmuramic acid 6-phosphate etherase [Clostridiales bacterium]